MSCNAWPLVTSPRALWSLERWDLEVRRLRPLDRSSARAGAPGDARCGWVLWGNVSGRCAAAIAWGWCEVRPGVLAIDDPMAVQSNIEWLDDQGRRLHDGVRLIWLNRVIYRLPWQQEVLEPRPGPGAATRVPNWRGRALLAHSVRRAGEVARAARVRRNRRGCVHDR